MNYPSDHPSAIVCLLAAFLLSPFTQAADPEQKTANREPQTAPPLPIGSQLQLLLDPRLIASSSAIEHRLHTPVQQPPPKSPLIGHYATVIKDGPLYRAYYRGNDPTYKGKSYSGHPGEITCYAESRDGHEWTFPKLGLFEVNGTRENNVILAHQPPYSTNFSPFLDTRPNVDPKERFKALAGHPGYDRQVKATGLAAFISADGIHWQRRDKEDVIPYDPSWSHAFDSQNVSFWSEAEGQYVCYFRTWCPNPAASKDANAPSHAEAGAKGTLRSISRTTSPDFRTWSSPVAMNPNLPGEHLYTSQTAPYYRAPHLYIATPTRYVAGHLGAEKTHSMLGSTDILLMTTRAGTNTYDHPYTDAFIRPGLDPHRWQSRANYLALNIIPTAPNEISLYHARSGHRLTLRTDGFASAHATSKKGQFITPPMTFSGTTLHLNLSTSAAGSITVEIQDTTGSPIEGFTLADCPPIVGDSIDRTVTWKNNPALQNLAGKPIRLRFVLQEADLFAFQFRDSNW
jgi:hypothetical protein